MTPLHKIRLHPELTDEQKALIVSLIENQERVRVRTTPVTKMTRIETYGPHPTDWWAPWGWHERIPYRELWMRTKGWINRRAARFDPSKIEFVTGRA